jgi:hypothetical protein
MSAISIVFDNYNQTAGDYRAYLGYPALTNSTNPYEVKSDSSIKRGGSGTSLRLTPYHATEKAASAPIGKGVQVAVAASGNFTISCYVRKSHTSDGDSYTYDGDAPRLIVRRNDALGVTADTVIATHPGGESAGAWTQVSGSLSGVGITPSQAGVLEFYVDAAHDVDAFINIDDWAVS